NPDCVRGMGNRTGNPRGAWDTYRHFLAMFGHTVAGIPDEEFTHVLAEFLQETGAKHEDSLDAGQMESLCQRMTAAYRQHTGKDMPTKPWDMLVEAINAVFRSWNSERAVTYRTHHQIEGLLGTSVTVQMMCPSEVSGVMFTANPVNPSLEQILIESSYGLGEAIVLGKVTPDRFVLDKKTLVITQREISVKDRIISTLSADGRQQVRRADAASLTDVQIADLARLGLRVENYFHVPCDIEWALSQGQFFLLQARPIKALTTHHSPLTTHSSPELEQIRREEIAILKAKAEPGGTVWSRYNLAEVLPAPTPMTWAIVRRFMSGRGGFGLMYRDLGFDPDPALDEEGIFDLICGRPYCNLSREPRMQYRTLPFEHPFAVLKANPSKALYPQAALNPARAGWRFWLFFPAVVFKLVRSGMKLRRLSRTLAEQFRNEIVPAFVSEAKTEAGQDICKLEPAELLARLNHWIQRTLYDFARDSLKPTALAAVAFGNLERALGRLLAKPGDASGMDRAQAVLRELVMGVRPDPGTDLPGAIRDLAEGKLDRAAFLRDFGHRGNQEMELSRPRWFEEFADRESRIEDRGSRIEDRGLNSEEVWKKIAAEGKLTAGQRAALEAELQTLHTYLGLRESAKHYLMQGYALIRRYLVELDRRYQLDGRIFFLVPDELPGLVKNQPPQVEPELTGMIAQRRRRRELALSLPVPQVLFSDDLDAIGRQVELAGVEVLQGVPLSAGVAEGMALVLEQPTTSLPGEPFILVCPSTDPAWVPLFVQAKGLVMETGGVLSHGAIVAREFGLPAVAGLPDVQRRLRTGQRLRVDGATGKVNILA
ncbi:MAG TPA: PEP/pyruvate-binding domain-containing protein, partial [Gemmataceae bacterium]|nr:PEP/pyruvate-binding domain-containing protein [Gemmataceae bacterium]